MSSWSAVNDSASVGTLSGIPSRTEVNVTETNNAL